MNSISYLSEGTKAYLLLKLQGGKEVKYDVASESVWKYFKEVTPESQCKIGAWHSGKETLECRLDDDGTLYGDFLHLSHYLRK